MNITGECGFPATLDCMFSVRNVIASALIELFEDYAELSEYFIALTEFVDFAYLKTLAMKMAEKYPENAELMSGLADAEDADDIGRAFSRTLTPFLSRKVLKSISATILKDAPTEKLFFRKAVSGISPIDKVAKFFSLSEGDARVLAFLACWYKTSHFDSLCDRVSEGRERSEVLRFMAKAVGIESFEVNAAMKTLKEKRITDGGRRHFPDLSSEIEEFIFEYDGSDLAQKFSAVLEPEKVFPVESFEVEKADANIISKLLCHKGGAHILLHGKPGSGKTEFAKSVANELGKKIFVPARKDEKKNSLTPVKINATLFAAQNGNGIALIDEADDFLETEHRGFSLFAETSCNLEKGCVNTLLDESRAPVVWITNSIAGIDESTRRRFAYTLEFSGVSDKQRRLVLETSLRENKLPVALSEEIFPVVRQYALSPAGISLSIKNAKIVSPNAGPELLENIRRIAENHYSLITGKMPAGKTLQVDECFDVALLNTNPPIDEIAKNIGRYREVVRREGRWLPIAMLFSGAPGTGKTQLGRYIARLLDREILIKRMSDIKNPYVGMTEKNIAAAFREAERSGSVLMIDEADTLFIDRQTARQSWESSETNEILAQMEAFKGVFICTTNLLENFDVAAMRRFHWKIEFRPLSIDGRMKIFRSYFPQLNIAEEWLWRELVELEGICPGDFCAVRERMRYDTELTAEKILKALRCELRYKLRETAERKSIGFA